jgi:TRAP-type uncharacterized transport system substrate-binding protein
MRRLAAPTAPTAQATPTALALAATALVVALALAPAPARADDAFVLTTGPKGGLYEKVGQAITDVVAYINTLK